MTVHPTIDIQRSTTRPLSSWLRGSVASWLVATSVALAQSGGGYNIKKSTIDSGGHSNLTGGGYKLGGTVGQYDASDLTGGAYWLTGGFWSPAVAIGEPPNNVVWDPTLNPIPWPNNNPLATTRSLRFKVTGAVGPSKLEAIKVTMVDLQHPKPANLPAQAPPNFTTFDTRTNGVCVGGTLNGHHCDATADCASPGTCTGGLAACTADPACGNAAQCTLPSNSCTRWVGKPGTFLEFQDFPAGATYRASRLQCTPYYHDWKPEGLITVVGAEILPSSEYSVQTYGASCMGAEAGCPAASTGVTMYTRRSGDTGPNFNPPATSTQPDALDIAAVVNKAKQSTSPLVQKSITQLQPNLLELNADVSALDISVVVDAVRQIRYAYSGPCPCPSTVTCGATACPGGVGACTAAYGAGAMCVKTCAGGANAGDPCINNTHCPGSSCGTPLCRDRCGRCSPP